ncbi:DEAD/DEAH box helicase [Sphingomonas corticis]|nr:DEAD/DEAH box helicase [Sphingomonas corticis]
MTKLAGFQQRTVDVALSALEGDGPRRFLVADEVGLGKTIIARAVAQGLRGKRRQLNLMYLCPSLEIAGQNRSKFVSLTGKEEKDYNPGEDRLALVPGAPPERRISKPGFNRMAAMTARARGRSRSRDWRTIDAIGSISSDEVRALADYLLSAPGAIVARCARRHDVPTADRGQAERVFDFAWNNLRGYLGHRVFAEAILGASKHGRYTAALREAMLKGGFEAVLDEQMVLLGQLGDAKGPAILDELAKCLLDRPSLVRFRRGKSARLRIPVQAVTPFAGGEQRKAGKKRSGKLRSDTLRRAFNSPFWPHVLCTTSVGQEGLDFHLWCRRIVHWDLPSDPVDFEQREGRIARYASLAVRKSLGDIHGAEALARTTAGSPFSELLAVASEQEAGRTGLERWWLPERGKPLSVSFDWRFSLRSRRRDEMLEELLYYRLALGQPDPDAFVAMLRKVGAHEGNPRELAINLAAVSRPVAPA